MKIKIEFFKKKEVVLIPLNNGTVSHIEFEVKNTKVISNHLNNHLFKFWLFLAADLGADDVVISIDGEEYTGAGAMALKLNLLNMETQKANHPV